MKAKQLLILCALFLGWVLYESGKGYSSSKAVRVILGEAADQSFAGKLAVGEVIRRRGKISGFSSMEKDLNQFYKEQPEFVRTAARFAWIVSRFTNITRGADHFDNVRQFGEPSWAKGMKKTIQINGTQFYKS